MILFRQLHDRPLVRVLIAASIAIGTTACADLATDSQPELTSLDIQSIQKRDYEIDSSIAFASVVSVFQDLGYIIDNADKGTGFITAHSPSTDNTGLLELFLDEDVTTISQTKATAVIEPIAAERTSIRLNFVVGETESSKHGTSTFDKPIYDADTYQNAFDKIEDAVFIRQSSRS